MPFFCDSHARNKCSHHLHLGFSFGARVRDNEREEVPGPGNYQLGDTMGAASRTGQKLEKPRGCGEGTECSIGGENDPFRTLTFCLVSGGPCFSLRPRHVQQKMDVGPGPGDYNPLRVYYTSCFSLVFCIDHDVYNIFLPTLIFF